MAKYNEKFNEKDITHCSDDVIRLCNEVVYMLLEKDYELFNTIYRDIADRLGTDIAIEIYSMFKGQQISFPKRLLNPSRIQRNIIQEYDGTNIKDLAIKYDYSERMIRKIIQDSVEE
ncbi:MAG: Mor transcription activator family protein [Clostridia bacterium]|nr:Mor transcription activator family protein [Clostridia bacterium]